MCLTAKVNRDRDEIKRHKHFSNFYENAYLDATRLCETANNSLVQKNILIESLEAENHRLKIRLHVLNQKQSVNSLVMSLQKTPAPKSPEEQTPLDFLFEEK